MQEGGRDGAGWLRSIASFFNPSSWFRDTAATSSQAQQQQQQQQQRTEDVQQGDTPPTKRAKLADIALPRRTHPSRGSHFQPQQAGTGTGTDTGTSSSSGGGGGGCAASAGASQAATTAKPAQEHRSSAPWKKREDGVRLRKRAILMGFNGAGYYGMQRNHGFDTIEEELLSAMLKAKVLPKEGYARSQAVRFQRCARTDKSVSAGRQIVSLEMFPDEDAVEKINEHLPPAIRIFTIIKSTKGFNAKKACSGRRYEYLLPTYALSPKEMAPRSTYRVTQEQLDTFQSVLDRFVGTHRFHNYTSGKKMSDPSCKRHILYFKYLPPFERDGIEWVTVQVKGQSFMLHQIRKMIGMAVAVTRGFAKIEDVFNTMNRPSVDVPRIPGLGLYLDSVFFDYYNKKFKNSHEPMSWEQWEEEIEQFKADYIVSSIVKQEKEDEIIKSWLSNLYHHKYEAKCREPKSADDNQQGGDDDDGDDGRQGQMQGEVTA